MNSANDRTDAQSGLESLTAQVRRAIPPDTDSDIVGRALANALLIEVQLLLDRISTDDDIELFFETFSHEWSDTIAWAAAILNAISMRHLAEDVMLELYDRTATRAVNFIKEDSPLAFGNRPRS